MSETKQNREKFDELVHALPSDLEAERSVLGIAMEYEVRLREAITRIRAEHFTTEAHRIIWTRICEMFDAGEVVSSQILVTYFATGPGEKQRESIGGFSYIVDLAFLSPDVSVEPWVRRILDTYARRQLMLRCNEAMIRLSNRQESLIEIAQSVEEECRSSVNVAEASSGFKNFEDMIRECGGLQAFLSRGRGDSVSYPWPTLTQMTNGGMKPGQLITIAGQSGKGKTALVLNIMLRSAQMGHGTPLLFSLEMPKDEIGGRMLALISGVDTFHFTRLTDDQRDAIREGRRILAESEYLVDDEDSTSMTQIYSRTKNEIARRKVSVVVIDTIQLVEGRRGVRENREQEVATITRQMKRMAMKLAVPVIGLSQTNDLNPGEEPELKNLRESRAIGHNSNLVMFLHYTRPYDVKAGIHTGELDLIIAKQRGGPEGRVRLEFHAPTGAFYERDGANG